MKKRLITILLSLVLTISLLSGCSENSESDVKVDTNVNVETNVNVNTGDIDTGNINTGDIDEGNIDEGDFTKHEHAYTESITKEATCTEAGEKTFTCECGDTYTEQIEATGHNFAEYVSNNDSTYMADGTETATCVCGLTDTRTASGTKLELPAEPNLYGMEFEEYTPKVPHYCMEDTDVYFEPSFQGPVIGHLNINDEVKITGNSNNYAELGNDHLAAIYYYPPYSATDAPMDIYWKRIDYNGQTGYIPYEYTWKAKRDTSITLNPLYANYPTIGGGGSGLFYPYEKEWRYVYGCNSRKTIYLNPHCTSVDIYDGIGLNVIATITDSSIKFETTGNAYATYRDDVMSYYIYEIYYDGEIAYIDSLNAMRE